VKQIGLLIAAAGTIFAASAHADPYKFTITGDYHAVFYLDSAPLAQNPLTDGSFALYDVPGFPDAALGLADITFFNGGQDGGLEIDDYYGGGIALFVADGPQLYSGTEDTPAFVTGTFALTQYRGTGTYTLNIAAMNSPAPEPESWALMLGGFGFVGGVMRARSRAAVSFS
jgi:hypothetical protein